MRTKVAVSSVIDGGRKLVEVKRKVQLYEMVLVTSFKLHYFCVLSVVSLMVFKNERQNINSYRWNLYRI